MTKPLRIVGINFDHFHMGDLLRMAHDPLPAKFQNPIACMGVCVCSFHFLEKETAVS
jgi:hypothetical protein